MLSGRRLIILMWIDLIAWLRATPWRRRDANIERMPLESLVVEQKKCWALIGMEYWAQHISCPDTADGEAK